MLCRKIQISKSTPWKRRAGHLPIHKWYKSRPVTKNWISTEGLWCLVTSVTVTIIVTINVNVTVNITVTANITVTNTVNMNVTENININIIVNVTVNKNVLWNLDLTVIVRL